MRRRDQESRDVAIGVEYLRLSPTDRIGEPTCSTLIQRLVDEGAVYVAQAFTPLQFATLSALFERLPICAKEHSRYLAADLDRDLTGRDDTSRGAACALGLDELDALSCTRAGYAFAELTPEIQDAMLELVAAGNLASVKLNLAAWLEELRHWAADSSVAAR
jgi:hypothetical protein